MNLGLSDVLKSNFSNITPVDRPIVLTRTNNKLDPNWIAGFTTGDGNFYVDITKSKSNKIGFRVQLNFRIYQHERDIKLIEYLIKYLGAGKLETNYNSINQVVSLRITKLSDIKKNNYSIFWSKSFEWSKTIRLSRLM